MRAVNWFIDGLEMVPGTIWAAALVLAGVIYTSRSNLRNLRLEFANDRRERVDERKHALRRDLYLAATEAIVACMASAGRFIDLNIPDQDLSKVITDRMPEAAK